jgi:broad specificity phosphatase PhoE
MIIYLVRHGITDACNNSDKSLKNVYLNDEGKQQINNISKKISKIDKIFTSPTLRTIETANIIRINCNEDANIITDYRLLNKVDDGQTYINNLRNFLDYLKGEKETILLVTHGRIIKMIYSIVLYNTIDINFIDGLSMDYGSISKMEYINKKFNFLEFNLLR